MSDLRSHEHLTDRELATTRRFSDSLDYAVFNLQHSLLVEDPNLFIDEVSQKPVPEPEQTDHTPLADTAIKAASSEDEIKTARQAVEDSYELAA